ncbi:nuclear transport factor 2 family protein [Actinoplanes oblitus]|uniref:Nuclear transport factor 2 family protein n=1 Tax=Actinoplanes oblitus TaxID=3040509 RepID=A0ABY8W7E9_9ACTN|nr:nuclear transport factor 2 family protein [Actinoplanes oblitus]WIM93769.1 nuclear transport factor 2 family protein [Actinoplanes oblitus]
MDTPREVFARLSGGIGRGEWDTLGELYAPDAEVVMPFDPQRTRLRGRDEVARRFAAAASMPIRLSPENVRVHETADPEVIVAEYDYAGPGFRVANIQVLRIRDGLIVESRDYHDHGAITAALRS